MAHGGRTGAPISLSYLQCEKSRRTTQMQTAGQAKTAATPASPDAPHPADGGGAPDAVPPADSGGPSARPRPCPPGRTDDWVLTTV